MRKNYYFKTKGQIAIFMSNDEIKFQITLMVDDIPESEIANNSTSLESAENSFFAYIYTDSEISETLNTIAKRYKLTHKINKEPLSHEFSNNESEPLSYQEARGLYTALIDINAIDTIPMAPHGILAQVKILEKESRRGGQDLDIEGFMR